MSGNNESTSSSAKQQQSYQSNEIDKLLNSGKITNAVDFLHYFKNKNFTTVQANQTNTTPHHQPNVDKPKRQKKSKSNLNDYVNIIQPNQQSSSSCGQQMKHNASFNNGVPNNNNKGSCHKKTFSSNNISSLQASSTNNSNGMKQTNSNMSLSSISIPDRQSPSPNSVQTATKAQFNKQRKSGINNSIPQVVPTQSIFNAYQINENSLIESTSMSSGATGSSSSGRPSSSNALELDSLNISDQQVFKEQSPQQQQIYISGNSSTTNTSPTPSTDPTGSYDFSPAAANSDGNNPQSISSQFLKNSAYYQKYRQQNQVQQHQQPPQQVCHNVQNYEQTDRKKEEAINRIIRNEKIKQIRTKMFEYELLKEYGALNPLPASIPSDLQLDKGANDSSDQPTTNYIKPFIPSNSKAAKKLKKQQAKANNLFSSYNIDENIEDSDSDDKSSMSSQTNRSYQRSNMVASRSSTTFEYYKDDVYNMGRTDEDSVSQRGDCENANDLFYGDHTTNEEDDDDFLFSDSYTNKDDDNYESGIEEDSSFCKPMSNNANQGTKTVKGKKVKPGYERYDIGSVNCFGLSAFAQSTFHLKCSIINTEVKNIMNVLKQVYWNLLTSLP